MCIATLALVGAGISAGGAVVGGIGQAQAASYQAKVAANNAAIAQQNAQYSAKATAAQTEAAGLKARQENAGIRARAAAQGLDVNTGSAADVETSQRQLGALDVATVASRGAEQVYGYESQATSFQAQSAMDRAEVPYDIAGGAMKAAGTLLSNPSVDSGISSAFGGGGGSVGAPTLAEGYPAPPPNYDWMSSSSGASAPFE